MIVPVRLWTVNWPFWVATALATSAAYRLKRAPDTLGPILSAIRQLAG